MCIHLNGERGDYFTSFKGLRQGDPLSPLLFNLVADALSTMLSRACAAGMIKGLVPHLVEGGLTHLQYADDTILLLQFDLQTLRNVRVILSCYEAMSGMKTNSVGLSVVEMNVASEMLGCKSGVLPMKYLRMPVSCHKISKA